MIPILSVLLSVPFFDPGQRSSARICYPEPMKSLLSLLLVALVLLHGCSTAPPPRSLSDNPLVRISAIDDGALFSAPHDGSRVAIAADGLSLYESDSQLIRELSGEEPLALAWSRDGSTLAAAFHVADYETRVSLYSAKGDVLRQLVLPVALTRMTWSTRGDLLATGLALKNYTFGGNLRQALYRIDMEDTWETLLTDSTLRPSLVKQLAPVIGTLQPVAFSPDGDELAYLHLHDPPEFAPYLELKYRNWQSDEERTLQRLPQQAWRLAWGSSDDSIELLAANDSHVFELYPPVERAERPALQEYTFHDGRLHDGRQLLADWGETARWQPLDHGRFLLAVEKTLYLGDGLRPVSQKVYSDKLWNLRRWRFEGLINQGEYQKLLREAIQ